jgi:hypothetical protein
VVVVPEGTVSRAFCEFWGGDLAVLGIQVAAQSAAGQATEQGAGCDSNATAADCGCQEAAARRTERCAHSGLGAEIALAVLAPGDQGRDHQGCRCESPRRCRHDSLPCWRAGYR